LGASYDGRLMRRLTSFATPFVSLLILTGVVMLATSLAGIVGPYVQKEIIDAPLATGNVAQLHLLALIFFGAAALQVASGMGYSYLLNRAAYEVLRRLRQQLFQHLQSLSLSFYDRYKVGRLMSIMTGDINAISNLLSSGILQTASDAVILIGIIGTLIALSPKLAIISIGLVPVIGITTQLIRNRIRNT